MKRSFALVFTALLLATCASSTDSNQTSSTKPSGNPYSPEAKTIPVGAIPAGVIHDAARNKDLVVSIDYPTHDGPYPVVIFSHEYGAPENSYVGLSAFWASHGYVVIRPHHADFESIKQTAQTYVEPVQRGGRRGSRSEPEPQQQAREFRPDPSEVWTSQTPSDWANRVADIKLVIDSIPQLVQQFPEIKDRVDATKIGVSGHSYGAFTAMLAGGVRTFSGGKATSYADPRVKAVVAMAPPGPSEARGLTKESFATLNVPTLFLTGSMDYGATQAEDPAWRKQAFELSPAGDKWFVSISGIGPSAFTGRFGIPAYIPENPPVYVPAGPGGYPPGQAPPVQQQPQPPRENRNFRQLGQANNVRTISLAFWDAYLKNETTGRDYLKHLQSRSDMQVATK